MYMYSVHTDSPHPVASTGQPKAPVSPVGVEEVLLLGVESRGIGPTHPYLLSLLDNELIVYRAFQYRQTQNAGHLQLRFSKVRGWIERQCMHREHVGKQDTHAHENSCQARFHTEGGAPWDFPPSLKLHV